MGTYIKIVSANTAWIKKINEDVLPNEATGFKKSIIWNKLYNFQKIW